MADPRSDETDPLRGAISVALPEDDAETVREMIRTYQSRDESTPLDLQTTAILRGSVWNQIGAVRAALCTMHIACVGGYTGYYITAAETEALMCADAYGERVAVLQEINDRGRIGLGEPATIPRADEIKSSAEANGTTVVLDRVRVHLDAIETYVRAGQHPYDEDDEIPPDAYDADTYTRALTAIAMIPFANDREGPDEYMPGLREVIRRVTIGEYFNDTVLDIGTVLAYIWKATSLPPRVIDEVMDPGPRAAVFLYNRLSWWVKDPELPRSSTWVSSALFLVRRALTRHPESAQAIREMPSTPAPRQIPDHARLDVFDMWAMQRAVLYLALLGDFGLPPPRYLLEVMRAPVPEYEPRRSLRRFLRDYYNGTGLLAEAERLLRTTPESVLTATSDVLRRANEERKEGASSEAEAKRYAYVTLLGTDVASIIAQYVNGTVPRHRSVFTYNALLPDAQRASASTDGERPAKRARTEARFQACPHCHDSYARVY